MPIVFLWFQLITNVCSTVKKSHFMTSFIFNQGISDFTIARFWQLFIHTHRPFCCWVCYDPRRCL